MATKRSITAANAILMLSATSLFDVAQQIQGFAADDVFDADAMDIAETQMGVDGKLSAGWVPVSLKQGYTVQADSPSIDVFEQIYAAQQAVREVYWLQGVTTLKAVGKRYTMLNGILRNYKPLPDAKKTLQARKFIIEWESIKAASI